MPGLLQRHAPAAQLHFVRQCQEGIRSEQPPDGSVDRELPLVRQRDQFPVLEGEYRRHGLGIAQQHFDERRPQRPIQGADPSGRRSQLVEPRHQGQTRRFRIAFGRRRRSSARGRRIVAGTFRTPRGRQRLHRPGCPHRNRRGDGFAREPIPYNGSAPDLGAYEYNQ